MPTLARRRLGTATLMIFGVVASSPLTVLVGGIPATYAGTKSIGVPLAFLVVTVMLLLLSTSYLHVTCYITHTAPFFALVTRGLGGRIGVACAVVMFFGYNAIQISLYGFLGNRMVAEHGGTWWAWAAGAWVVGLGFGLLRLTANAVLLGSLLLVELTVIGLVVAAVFTHPAAGDAAPFTWGGLAGPGLLATLALTVAAFIGPETGPVYGEEARSPRTVTVATYCVVAGLGVLYALLAWAIYIGVGMSALVGGGDPTEVVFDLLRRTYGGGLAWLTSILLVTSVWAAMMSFHHVIGRQLFGLARDELLPKALRGVSQGTGGGTPIAGSLVQSAFAGVVLLVFARIGIDPMVMFVWLSTIGALFILALMVTAAAAAVGFYRRGGGTQEGPFQRAIAPIGGAVAGGLVLVGMGANLRALPVPSGSSWMWQLPLILLAGCAAVGWVWGAVVQRRRRHVFTRLGHREVNPILARDPRLDEIEV